jgi:LmbE family N-acetylglucosaminyl deacetylase
VSTIVFLHAHPDDEASQTSGTMSRAVGDGHRVVLVVATNGDHGTPAEDLEPGETVVDRRRRELATSAEVIGVHRVVWLGYADSGMHGWDQNTHEAAFTTADVDEAAARFAAVLDEEDADVAVGYDWHGNYGHPDHVQVHRVLHRGAGLAARRPRVLEVTFNRDRLRALSEQARAAGREATVDPDAPWDDGNPMGTPEAELHWSVDVSDRLGVKRAALASHASQVEDVGMMLALPPEDFAAMFGTEYFIEPAREPGMVVGWPFGAS